MVAWCRVGALKTNAALERIQSAMFDDDTEDVPPRHNGLKVGGPDEHGIDNGEYGRGPGRRLGLGPASICSASL